MSQVPHRVNILRYDKDTNLYFIKYDSEIRNFLIEENIMHERDEYPFEFELSIPELKQFVESYDKGDVRDYPCFSDQLKKDIDDNDMILAFKKEIYYADVNNEVYLTYHIF